LAFLPVELGLIVVFHLAINQCFLLVSKIGFEFSNRGLGLAEWSRLPQQGELRFKPPVEGIYGKQKIKLGFEFFLKL
jgi:hypothetical protein